MTRDAQFRLRNRNRFRNQPYFSWNGNWNVKRYINRPSSLLESEPESESENLVLESESGILNLVTSLS